MANAAPTSYDEMPYTNKAFAQSHPDRLATLARLFRDMMVYHSSQFEGATAKVQQARALLDFQAQSVPTTLPYGMTLRQDVSHAGRCDHHDAESDHQGRVVVAGAAMAAWPAILFTDQPGMTRKIRSMARACGDGVCETRSAHHAPTMS